MAISWMKTGEESHKAHEEQKAKQAVRNEERKAFRFFLQEQKDASGNKTGKYDEASIWFVDGAIGKYGALNPPRFYEHNVYLTTGGWQNIVCPEQTLPNKAKESAA